MVSRPGPNDATTSTGIKRHRSPVPVIAPTPRRATTDSFLTSSSESPSSDELRGFKYPLLDDPLRSSTPSVLINQLRLNEIPNARNGPSPGGRNVSVPRHGHSRNSSWGSTRSALSQSPKKSARFSPQLTINSPTRMHIPPPPGATPIRSSMRTLPRTSPDHHIPIHEPRDGSTPNITIIQATPPSPTSSDPGARRSYGQPRDWRANTGGGRPDGDNQAQRTFSSSPGSSRHRASAHRRTPSVNEGNDSGYFSPHSSALEKWRAHMPGAQPQGQSQRSGNTVTPPQDQTGVIPPTNQNQSASSSQVNQSGNQQRLGGSRIHTSWQAPFSPDTCTPVIPGHLRRSVDSLQNQTNHAFSRDLGGASHAIPTPARPARRLTNADLAPINTSFGHPPGGESNTRPRSSRSRASQHVTPHDPVQTAPTTPARKSDVDVNTVVNDLMKFPPTSMSWQTPRGVLTWTPHPALPDSGPSLLDGGRGDGNGFGRRGGGNGDLWTGGYPMPGACPTWTPGAWPPAATSRLIQLAPWMIPNPCNASLPHIMWDISQLPTTAKRITGNHVIVSVMDKLDDVATHPAVDRLVVVCKVGVAEKIWGHIEVKATKPEGVTAWDVFNGIFKYFHKRVGRRELDRMKEMLGDDGLEEKMAGAFYQRIRVAPALPGYELKEGLKRVDCLGDATFFWGLYTSYNDDGTWQLNLGLVNRRRFA